MLLMVRMDSLVARATWRLRSRWGMAMLVMEMKNAQSICIYILTRQMFWVGQEGSDIEFAALVELNGVPEIGVDNATRNRIDQQVACRICLSH
jgi:hypothetical protein